MKNKFKTYAIGILIPVAVGLFSAFLTRNNMNLYDTISTPPLSPPGILFPIVWTILYILMGISSTSVYISKDNSSAKRQGLTLYRLQLIINFFWSIFFFNNRAFLLSFIWLCVLWVLILGMIIKFYRVNKAASLLQIPYLLWVSFAGYLNFMIWLLN